MDKTIDLVDFQIKEFVESLRPPMDLREQLDIGYRFQKNTLELFEIRPKWDKPEEKIEVAIAKTKFVKCQGIWKIYWVRASGEWKLYEPMSEVNSIHDFFEIINKDTHGCFFG